MVTLTKHALPTENGQFMTRLFLYNGLAAEMVLLPGFAVQNNALAAATLALLLLVACATGWWGAKRIRLARPDMGFLIGAGGMLLLVLASRETESWRSLIPGAVVSGVGQGMVLTAVNAMKSRAASLTHSLSGRTGLFMAGSVLLTGICLAIVKQCPGMSGFPYAFALLLDLALLGALYAKLNQQERE